MKHLIILNFQPDIPPFMVSQMMYAKDVYDRISYVNTRKVVNSSLFDSFENVRFYYPSSFRRGLASLVALFRYLNPINIHQLFECVSQKGLSFRYIKQLYMFLASDACIRPYVNSLVAKQPESVTLLSTWFGASAVTAAHVKKHKPIIRAFSMAHSFEILVSRNPYIPFLFNGYKFRYLDKVIFIAERMRQLYFDGVQSLPSSYTSKTCVCYLGSYKEDFNTMNKTVPGIFNICTCSRMIPLKRLDVLCEALRKWECGEIRWTHLGNGEMEEQIRELAESVMVENPLVSIVLAGHKENSGVKAFYASEPIDLFCNFSTIEGLPISIMEAISYGIPVLATDVGGTAEIVKPEFGFLMSPDINASSVRQELVRFLNLSEDHKCRMRSSAFDFWQANFNARQNLKKFFDILQ